MRHRNSTWDILRPLELFLCSFLWLEIIYRLFCVERFFDRGLLYILLFSIPLSVLCAILCSVWDEKGNRINAHFTEAKKVKIKLPLTRTEKDDVFVGINGKRYLVKRGVEVAVPLGVAKILERKEKMLSVAMEFEAKAAAPLEELAKQQ